MEVGIAALSLQTWPGRDRDALKVHETHEKKKRPHAKAQRRKKSREARDRFRFLCVFAPLREDFSSGSLWIRLTAAPGSLHLVGDFVRYGLQLLDVVLRQSQILGIRPVEFGGTETLDGHEGLLSDRQCADAQLREPFIEAAQGKPAVLIGDRRFTVRPVGTVAS
jgi:hypothetical protein